MSFFAYAQVAPSIYTELLYVSKLNPESQGYYNSCNYSYNPPEYDKSAAAIQHYKYTLSILLYLSSLTYGARRIRLLCITPLLDIAYNYAIGSPPVFFNGYLE
jgi:hypothetical protein